MRRSSRSCVACSAAPGTFAGPSLSLLESKIRALEINERFKPIDPFSTFQLRLQ